MHLTHRLCGRGGLDLWRISGHCARIKRWTESTLTIAEVNIEEALEDTIGWFLQVVDMDYPPDEYPDGLIENDIEYIEYSDF